MAPEVEIAPVPEAAEARSTESEVRGFFGRDLVYAGLWASQMALTTCLTAVVTRVLGPAHYGVAATCLTLMQLISAIAGFGLQVGIQRAHARWGDEAARVLVLVAYVISGAFFAIALISSSAWIGPVGLAGSNGAVVFTLCWAALTAATNATLGLLRSRDQLTAFVIVNLLQTALAELLSLALVLTVAPSAKQYIAGEMIGQLAALVCGLALTRPLTPKREEWSYIRETLRFCAPLLPVTVSNFVLNTSDRLILNIYAGSGAVGRYAVAANIATIPVLLIASLATSSLPRVFALSESDGLADTLQRTRDLLYLLIIPVIAALSIASPLLLKLWAPSSFNPMGLQLEVALIVSGTIPAASTITYERVLLSRSRSPATAVATTVAAGLNVALNLVLVPACGILGAAIATLVAVCVQTILFRLYSEREMRLRRSSNFVILWILAGLGVVYASVLLPTSLPFLIGRGMVAVLLGLLSALILWSLTRGRQRGAESFVGRLSRRARVVV